MDPREPLNGCDFDACGFLEKLMPSDAFWSDLPAETSIALRTTGGTVSQPMEL
ncbi:hypothetical protein [Methylobacterium isbiliense]|uniref:hypothetical protein n=1 Tax=Methylobacterium isbiliense TaxID=315478 RepID=UPI001EE2B25C|nr:hypothetical protein [Methylobacterium isbiliense]MDN3627525.1 hypothetical protein [Methylobacterium isbiliense]